MLLDDAIRVPHICATCERSVLAPKSARYYFTSTAEQQTAYHRQGFARCEGCGEYIHAVCNASLFGEDLMLCSHCVAERKHAQVDRIGLRRGLILVAAVSLLWFLIWKIV